MLMGGGARARINPPLLTTTPLCHTPAPVPVPCRLPVHTALRTPHHSTAPSPELARHAVQPLPLRGRDVGAVVNGHTEQRLKQRDLRRRGK